MKPRTRTRTARLVLTAADVRHLTRAVESGGAALLTLRLRVSGPRTATITSARLGWRSLT
jgi:hypothetical protein